MARFAKGSAEAKAWGAKMRATRGGKATTSVSSASAGNTNLPPAGIQAPQPVLPHQMIRAIKNSPKGAVPPGLIKYAKNPKSKTLIRKATKSKGGYNGSTA